jgi:hypothetical protein
VRTIYICRYVAGEELRRRDAASSTRATAMLSATGAAVSPAWLIRTGRIGRTGDAPPDPR